MAAVDSCECFPSLNCAAGEDEGGLGPCFAKVEFLGGRLTDKCEYQADQAYHKAQTLSRPRTTIVEVGKHIRRRAMRSHIAQDDVNSDEAQDMDEQ